MAMDAKPRQRTVRSWLQQLHLWVGLVLLLPLVVMGVTGAVLVYAHDLEHLLGQGEPAATTPGDWRPPSELVAAARQAVGEPSRAVTMVRWPSEVGQPAAVRVGRPSVQVLLDPVSLQPLATTGMTGWVRFFHDLHGHLFIAGGAGREIVGWLGVALLVLGGSGLFLWWPRPGRWKAAFTVRRGATGLRLHRELHGAIGIWSLVLFLLVNFTGVYLAFPQTVGGIVTAVLPGRDGRAAMLARVEPLPGAVPIGLDEAVGLARSRVPDARFLSAFLPSRPDQALRVALVRPGHAEGAPPITVVIDPLRRTVLGVLDPRAMTAGERFLAWQRALHYGNGLGPLYRFLVFAVGVTIPLFAITGACMWWIKRRNRRAARLAAQPGSGPRNTKNAPAQIRPKPTRWFSVMRSPR